MWGGGVSLSQEIAAGKLGDAARGKGEMESAHC